MSEFQSQTFRLEKFAYLFCKLDNIMNNFLLGLQLFLLFKMSLDKGFYKKSSANKFIYLLDDSKNVYFCFK